MPKLFLPCLQREVGSSAVPGPGEGPAGGSELTEEAQTAGGGADGT